MPNIPWPLAWLIIQLLMVIWHFMPHGVNCQWEYVTHTVRHKIVSVGFQYLCG